MYIKDKGDWNKDQDNEEEQRAEAALAYITHPDQLRRNDARGRGVEQLLRIRGALADVRNTEIKWLLNQIDLQSHGLRGLLPTRYDLTRQGAQAVKREISGC
jgi:hypothetical protein